MTDASGRETAAFHIPAEADLQACTCGNGLSGTGFGNGLRGRAFGNGLSGTTRGTDFRKRYAGNRPAGLIPSAEKGFCRISKYIYLCNEMITQDDIFGITDDAAFEAAALEVFRRQAAECPPYREYLALAGVRPEEVRAAPRDSIPADRNLQDPRRLLRRHGARRRSSPRRQRRA